MLPPLYDDQRRAIARVSTMLVLGAAAILPLTAQSSSIAAARETGAAGTVAMPALPGPITFPGFVLKRDPFAPRDAAAAASSVSSSKALVSGQADEIGIVLPPNAGAGGTSAVRAIVVGERTRALVDFGGSVRVLAVGDTVGTVKVVRISPAGVTFSDGSIWPLAGAK